MFIMKVPGINGLGKTNGCEKAGDFILESLNEIYSNEKGAPINVRLFDLEEIHLDNSNLELINYLIYKNSFETFEKKSRAVFLGGDHSISYSLTHAFLDFCRRNGKEPCLIVFDAHADCMKPVDGNFPTHEEWLRGLIEKGFPVENILLVGVRNQDPSEIQFLKDAKKSKIFGATKSAPAFAGESKQDFVGKGVKVISMNQLQDDLHETCDTIMEFASGKELYVSVDIDVIDPAFAPATGYCEPGGLTSRQFLYLIQRINKIKNLKAVDIVEINPEKDENELTIKLGAKILGELI